MMTARQNTLLTYDRLESLGKLLDSVKNIPGEIAQVGVYRGGSARLLTLHTDKRLYLFDTFEGLPDTDTSIDLHQKGDFGDSSIQHVEDVLKPYTNYEIHKGVFPADTGDAIKDKIFSFVYIDVDLYQGTKDCLEFFYSRLSPGGILVSDDYEMHSCPGVKKAFDEFMEGKKEGLESGARFQCHFIKK